jgi:hypothetical protein
MANNNHLGIYIDENIKKIFVIGDIHGDFYAFKQVLELTECVKFNDIDMKNIFQFNPKQDFLTLKDGCDLYNCEWNIQMKNIYIVFAGDLVDRCRNIGHEGCINTVNDENCDLKILKFIFNLDNHAKKYNSRVLMVLGNHEILNLDSDFRYVSFKGLYKNLNPLQKIDRVKEMCELFEENIDNVYGILQINNFIIVHGGINYDFFNNEIFNDNKLNKLEKFNSLLREFINKKGDSSLFNSSDSPFWDRVLGLDNIDNPENCKQIFENNILQVNKDILPNLKIIVAHCPQFLNDKSMNLTDCNKYEERIWRIDVGMSRAWDKYDYNNIKNLLIQLLKALRNCNFPAKLDFYKIQRNTSRKASVLQINSKKNQCILENKLVLDYFFDNIESKLVENSKYNINVLVYTYLLQDLYFYILFDLQLGKHNRDDNLLIKFNTLLNSVDYVKKKYILKIKKLKII